MTNISGKIALITGASSGIGAATARRFAKAGIMAMARRPPRSIEDQDRVEGEQALVLEMDVADKAFVEFSGEAYRYL